MAQLVGGGVDFSFHSVPELLAVVGQRDSFLLLHLHSLHTPCMCVKETENKCFA